MRFELPEAKKLTLEMVIPIRWGDMDAMGHVNNTIYFRYLEIVRIEWLHSGRGRAGPGGGGAGDRQHLLQLPAPAEVPGRRAGEALRREAGAEQLRGVRDAGADGRAGGAVRER